MEQKGLVGHEISGRPNLLPLVQRESTFRRLAGGFLDQVFDGAGRIRGAVLQLRPHSLEELQELERMIAAAKKDVRRSGKVGVGGER